MLNISKKRNFSNPEDNCPYHTYYFTRKQRGNYVNVWFPGCPWKPTTRVNKKRKPDFWNNDQYWTIKKVDEVTACNLYNRDWNPVCLSIIRSYSAFRKDEDTSLCDMKAQIYSIDDSSFGIWWNEMDKNALIPIRLEIMSWIDSQHILNGEEFIKFCLNKGANPESIDYN